MTAQIFGRLAGTLLLCFGLAGCIDVTADIDVTSDSTAKATMTQTIGAQFYPMIKAAKAQADASDSSTSSDFCDKGKLTENADGSATCVETKEGKFADLTFSDSGDSSDISFTSAGPGLVKVSFPTKGINESLTKDAAGASSGSSEDTAQEKQMKDMMAAYFAGHFLTFRVSGGEITDTNMTIAADRKSAETKIPFTDIINGSASVPDELYAVVRTN